MKNIKILDCTLRDGGYYNNWNFSKEVALEMDKMPDLSGSDTPLAHLERVRT